MKKHLALILGALLVPVFVSADALDENVSFSCSFDGSVEPDQARGSDKIIVGNFDKKIRGYGREDAVLTGIETRTSAPVKITRNENLESISMHGLYPAGEGAGFAGGIISAAVDGIKVAERIIGKYKCY